MKRRITCCMIIIISSILIMFSCAGLVYKQEKEQAAQQVLEIFPLLRFKKGADYFQGRDAILSWGRNALPYLEGQREKASTWQEELLADIMLLRIRNPRVFKQVEEIVSEAKRRGTHYGPNTVSMLFLQSKFVAMKEDPVLPALELMLFARERPDVIASLASALVPFKDLRVARPLAALLHKDAPKVIQVEIVTSIRRLRFPELGVDLVRFYHNIEHTDVKQRVIRALGAIGDERVLTHIEDLIKKEKEKDLKLKLQAAYRKIVERVKNQRSNQ